MVRQVRVLTPETSIEEARTRFDPDQADRDPMYDAADWGGPPFALQVYSASQSWAAGQRLRREPRVIDANDPDSVLQDARMGMAVLVNDGTRVGVIDSIGIDDLGRRDSVVVLYGRLTKRRKAVDGSLVDLVDDGVVMLSIDAAAFKALPDV